MADPWVIVAVVSMLLCLGIGAMFSFADSDWFGVVVGAICAALIGATWLICAWPVSSYSKDSCAARAEGYGLDRSQWSFRHGCRVFLPGGQLVPEGRIRITEDGSLFVGGDE